MPIEKDDSKLKSAELERRLQEAQREAAYYRSIAAESGKSRLRNMSQLSALIVEHKDIEQRLRESEERYRTVVENLNVGMLVTLDLKIAFANSAIAHFLGQSMEELLANPNPFDFIHPEDQAMVLDRHLKRLQAEPVPETYVFRVLTKRGETRWTEVTGTRIHWRGKPAILNFFIDITERVHAQETQKRLEQQLSRAQKMEALGTLAGGIAHDFNNLMTSALAYVSMMLCDTNLSHPHYEYLTHIEKQIRRGSKLTAQLLGYARQRPFQVKPLDLNRLVAEVAETFSRTRQDIIVQPQLHTGLDTVDADQGQLEQALLNLLVNASDAMPNGGVLALKTRNITHADMPSGKFQPAAGNYVELAVADSGIGMTPEIMERIFDPFFTTKEIGRGTGLGLASVFGVVKGHGGYIDVASRPGEGATFTLYLPARARAAVEPHDIEQSDNQREVANRTG